MIDAERAAVSELAGLTADEAATRLQEDGPNELPSAKQRTIVRQVVEVVRQPMLVLLLGAGTVNLLLAEVVDGLLLLSFVLVVIGISIYQEHKTENALVALRDLSAPRALVIRDGHRVRIPGRDVVRGDVVMIAEGDRVPADAFVLDSANLSVDESTLTGESVPVRKAPGDHVDEVGAPGGDGTPWVFSGTVVVKGHGIAVAQRTGDETELGRIGGALRSIETQPTPLQREIDRVVMLLALIGAAAAVGMVLIYGWTRGDWLEGTLIGIGTAMAMLPEEFPVVFTVFIAIGAWRMSHRRVLTRRPAVIETLGATTVLCVDKTGTLTLNRMTVQQLMVEGEHHALDGTPLPEVFHELAEFAVLASPVDPFDPMDRAFRDLEQGCLSGTEHVHRDWNLVREYPLSDDLLALSHVWRSPDLADFVIAAKGAPEAIADLCHLEDDATESLAQLVERASADGLRVLAVARARFVSGTPLPTNQHDFDFEYLGLVALHDPVRPGVPEAVAECRQAGIRIIMITGDYSGTGLAIATAIGLDTSDGYITGPQLATMSDDELRARIATVSIFARMVPEQKLRLVLALQARGEVVGMTGDGVNDAPSLRASDVGIAMGAHGTDVAREASDVVVTDDDFASIAEGVRHGRGIFDNLRKAIAYIIAVHVPMLGMAVIPVLVHSWPIVLLPVQIAFLQLIVDPACSIVFEAEQIDPAVMARFPRGLRTPMFDRRLVTLAGLQGLSVLAAVLVVYVWATTTGRPDEAVRSVAFAALVVSNLCLIMVNRSWRLSAVQTLRERRNPTLKWILGAASALLVLILSVPGLRDAFGFGAMRPIDWLVATAAAVAGVAWFEIYKIRSRRSNARPSDSDAPPVPGARTGGGTLGPTDDLAAYR